jgi:DNA-binding HxlR family transcriptional regulator
VTITLSGHFTDRSTWSMQRCPIARALAAIGPPSAVLVLSEAYIGTNRFGDFVRNLDMTESAVTARLNHLVDAGLLSRRPYKEPGQRTRYEYHLTQMGRDLQPVLVGLMEWGDTYVQGEYGRQATLIHADCGEPVASEVHCAGGHRVGVDDIVMRPADDPPPQRSPAPLSSADDEGPRDEAVSREAESGARSPA